MGCEWALLTENELNKPLCKITNSSDDVDDRFSIINESHIVGIESLTFIFQVAHRWDMYRVWRRRD